jgi:superfamily I DNA/RNA helicase
LEEEAQGITQFISSKIQRNEVSAGRILILAPRQKLGKVICDALNQLNIPAHSFYQDSFLSGNPKDLDQSQPQQALSFLTLLAKPTDRVALRCLCGFGSNSLNREPWQSLRIHCQATGQSTFDALDKSSDGMIVIPGTELLVEQFRVLRQRLHELGNIQGQPLVDAIFPVNQEWAESFRTISAQLTEEQKIPAQLYETIHTNIIQPELPTDVDYVRVMSLHKSKGLDADLVVITGCIQGLIPTPPDENLPLDIQEELREEQRRLFYVGISRTCQTLVLSSVVRIPSALAYQINVPVITRDRRYIETIASPYLLELGPNCPRPISGQDFLRTL